MGNFSDFEEVGILRARLAIYEIAHRHALQSLNKAKEFMLDSAMNGTPIKSTHIDLIDESILVNKEIGDVL